MRSEESRQKWRDTALLRMYGTQEAVDNRNKILGIAHAGRSREPPVDFPRLIGVLNRRGMWMRSGETWTPEALRSLYNNYRRRELLDIRNGRDKRDSVTRQYDKQRYEKARKLMAEQAEKGWSNAHIADWLNSEGYKTSHGLKFHWRNVRSLLSRPRQSMEDKSEK